MLARERVGVVRCWRARKTDTATPTNPMAVARRNYLSALAVFLFLLW